MALENSQSARPPLPKNTIAENRMFIGSSSHARELDVENTSLRAAVAELEELNKRDPLTGLLNKRAYSMMLTSDYGKVKVGEQQALGVVRLDLDNFSWVNDVLGGHHFGDMFLTATSDLIRKQLRGAKDSAFRVGGDEFALLLGGNFTPEIFGSVITRIHEGINTKALDNTLKYLWRSNRLVSIPEGKMEREGTVALKELVRGMQDLRDNADGARDHFMDHGRGSAAVKSAMLTKLDAMDFSSYEPYVHDARTSAELTTDERNNRQSLERRLSENVAQLFPALTVSMAGVLVGPQTEIDPIAVDRKVDTMVNAIKRHGGSAAQIQLL